MALNPGQIASIAEGATGLTAAIGGAIYGGIKSGKLNRRAESILQQQKNDNQRWYDVKMSSDYTQRADVQAAIKRQRELLNEQYERARAANTVAGGTDEALALQKQAANQSLSQTATDIAARAAAYKDNVESNYMARKASLEDQERLNYQQRAAATAQAASQVVNTGIKMVGDGAQHFVQASGSTGAPPEVSQGAVIGQNEQQRALQANPGPTPKNPA